MYRTLRLDYGLSSEGLRVQHLALIRLDGLSALTLILTLTFTALLLVFHEIRGTVHTSETDSQWWH